MYLMQFLFLTCLRAFSLLSRAPARGRARLHGAACRFDPSAPTRRALVISSRVCLIALTLAQAPARADADGQPLSVLRAASDVDPAQAANIDAALQTQLSKLREFSSVHSLPVPLEDLQLAAGCSADEDACLQLMSEQLEAGVLLVRQLVAQQDGSMILTLRVQDRALEQGVARRAQGVLKNPTADDIDRTLQRMLAQLFLQSIAPTTKPSLEAPAADRRLPDRRWRAGWALSALGVGLLTAGLTSALLSKRDERAYGRAGISTELDVDRARSTFERAEKRARLANYFGSAGAVITSLGVGTLLWELASRRSDAASTTLRVQPTAAGAMLTVDGTWRGGW
jgi:hypothetical protein